MRSLKRALLYGLIVWVVPFVAAIFLFPLRASERPLFESIMPVVVALAAVICATFYFRIPGSASVREGVVLGVVWLAVSVVLDLIMFMQGPMKMSLSEYVKDIAVTYLMIPVVTAGFGSVAGRGRNA